MVNMSTIRTQTCDSKILLNLVSGVTLSILCAAIKKRIVFIKTNNIIIDSIEPSSIGLLILYC